MKMLWGLAGFVMLLAGAADAQGPRGAGAAGFCAPTAAEHVSLATVAADRAHWMGHCVTVSGVYSGERVYADADAIYGVTDAWIGGYVDGRGSMDGYWTGEFTGRIADCKTAADNINAGLLRSPGILIDDSRQAGCVTPEGQFLLFMSQRNLEPAPIKRRLPKAKGGDLAPAGANWPMLANVQKIATDFVAALRAKDRAALTALTKNDYGTDMLLADETSAVADLRKPAERQMQVFLRKTPVNASRPNQFESDVCYCRGKDCSKSWPIARRDADNQASRPYACVHVDGVRESESAPWTYVAGAAMTADGLPEP
jgi:hypothetical protein